jgi:hypothetical protein
MAADGRLCVQLRIISNNRSHHELQDTASWHTLAHHAAQHLHQQRLKPLAVTPFLLEIFQQLLRPFELDH